MSRAFVKEGDGGEGQELPELQVSPHRNLVTATGLRQGELLGLRWDDLDLDARRLTVRHSLACVGGVLTLLEPKTSRSRRMNALPELAVSALRGHRTPPADGAAGGRLTLGGHPRTVTLASEVRLVEWGPPR